MKEKIKTAIQNEYSQFGLGQKTIDGAATFLETSVTAETTDEQLVTMVKGLSGLMKGFQSDADVIRSAKSVAEKKVLEFEEKMKSQPIADTVSHKTPESFKIEDIVEQIRISAAEEIAKIKTESDAYKSALQAEKRAAFINSEAQRIGIPDVLMGNMTFGVDIDDAGITSKLTEVKQVLVNSAVQANTAPVLTKTEVSVDEVAEIMKHIK